MEESNLFVTLFVAGLVLICIRYLTKYIVKYYNENDRPEKNETEEQKKSDGKANGNRTPQQNLMQQQHLVQNLNRNIHWRPNSNKPGAYTDPWHLTSLKGHTGRIRDMDFSSNGKFLATCAEDRTIFVWSLTSLPATRSFRINVPYDHATRVCWSPDNKALLVHTEQESNIMVFKLDKCKKDKESWFSGATNSLTFSKVFDSECVGLQISSDGRHVMSCSKDGKLVLFDTKGNVTQKIDDTGLGSNHCARLSPNAKFVIVCGFSPDVKLWSLGDDKPSSKKESSSAGEANLKRAFELTGHSGSVNDVAFEMQSLRVASVSKADGWRLYDIDVNYKKGQSPILLMKKAFGNGEKNSTTENDERSHVALSPDSNVICVSRGSDLMFYETEGGMMDRCIEKVYNTGPITGVKFDATGKYIFCTGDKHVRVFHNVTGYKIEIRENLYKLQHGGVALNSATTERISQIIESSRKFLESIGEKEWK